MALMYVPHMSAAIDIARCKASVPNGGKSSFSHQCTHKPWKGGWCKQHHPDARLTRVGEQLEKVTKQRDRLLELLEETDPCKVSPSCADSPCCLLDLPDGCDSKQRWADILKEVTEWQASKSKEQAIKAEKEMKV